MDERQKHEMVLETTHPSGAEEWSCPECGRRFVAQWEPVLRRVVLAQGDERIIHTGQGPGFGMQVSVDSMENDMSEKSELSDVWKQWLDRLDIDLGEDDDSSKRS